MSDKDDLWTADDIRKNATNWSLHCDGKLLEYMKNMSKTIQERGNRTNFNLHNSMIQLDRTKIALENATNQLMALQHKQFVENRVYDDDETLANVDNVPTQQLDEEPEISPTEAIREFVKSGVELMHEYFDKITIELSDSEDDGEEVQKNVVYKLKDRYKHRPLPYIIGSKEWQEKWHIGLAEDDIDESDNEEEEEDDASISSSPAISVSSNVPVSLSESENPTGGIPSRKSDAQDLFQSSSDENISKMPMPHDITDNNSTFRRQSQDTPKTVPIAKQIDTRETNTSNTIFRQQKQQQISHVIPTLIDSDPPDLDDVASIKTPHKPLNLFLDDDDDQDDFMFDKTTKVGKQADAKRAIDTDQMNVPSTSKIASINLFADDDDGDIDSFLPSTSKSITAKTALKKPEIKNLFDDDDDDDDDELFLQPPEPTKKITPRATILSNTPAKPDPFQHNIFDDEPPEDDFENRPSTSKASINPYPIQSPTKKTSDLLKVNLFDDDDDDDFEKLISSSSSSMKKSIIDDPKNEIAVGSKNNLAEKTKDKPIVTPKSKTNLFDSDRLFDDTPPSDDEQLFSSMSSKKNIPKPKPMEYSKQNTGEFYNDFSETVTSMPIDSISNEVVETVKPTESTKSTSVVEKPRIAAANTISKSIVDSGSQQQSETKPTSEKRSEFLKKIDSFSSANANEQKSETAPIPKARQPKKLNIGNIDINVAALLPGAKRAKSVEKSEIKESSDDISNDESPLSPAETVPTTARSMSQDNVDSSGRLSNLNRNRAKNLARRPSTRAGRKQQYQRSIESEEQIDGTPSQIEQTKTKSSPIRETKPVKKLNQDVNEMEDKADIPPNPTKSSLETKSPLKKNIFEDDSFGTTMESNKPTEKAEDAEIVAEVVNESDQLESENVQSKDENIEKENPFSFLEDEQTDEIDDFMIKPETPPPTTSVTIKATPAYIDELPPELDPIDDQPFSKDTKGNSSLSQNALSLFGDDDDDDDDDDDFDNDEMFAKSDITKTEPQPELPRDTNKPDDDWSPYSSSFVHEMPPASNDKKLPISSALSLFGDEDDNLDNDDEVFGAKPSAESKSEPKEQKQPTDIAQSSRSVVQEPSPVLSDTKLPGSSVLGLFDDDPDDNDLFDTIKPTESKYEQIAQKQPSHDSPPSTSKTQPVQLPVSSAASLFEDDVDNNDIFDKKDSKQSKNDSREEKSMPKDESKSDKKPPQSASKASKPSKISLFGDDDDDDDDGDLFGRPPPSTELVKQMQSKKADSKIFDDSSDDDLLFGGGISAKKNPPKSSSFTTSTTTAPKATKQVKSSGKLFSDSEDDDGDLFGSKSKPSQEPSKKLAPTQSTSKATKEESSKSVKTLSPSAIDNDPLADLLK